MVAVQHLISPATLPGCTTTKEQLSILSYNVLLPNSVDGWWTYKMYSPPLPELEKYQSTWEYRQELLRQRISTMNADIVCLQEVSPSSFEQDFQFMQDLGYDCNELFKRGRFRPATFWKSSVCELIAPPVHKDRTLLTGFKLVHQPSSNNNNYYYILNCHLQAGKQGPRRVRQINEGVRAVMTLARKQKEKNPEQSVRLVVVGDFNGGEECGAIRYLEDGYVDETFLEDGEPVTSSKKELPLATPMQDVTKAVHTNNSPSPPTLVVPEFISTMIQEGTQDTPEWSDDMIARLERVYNSLATATLNSEAQQKVMNIQDVTKWLTTINGQVGRGDEFREAARQMGFVETEETKKEDIQLPPNGILTLDGFKQVYKCELRAGKFWGIAHDMAVLGDPLPNIGLFTGRYDRIYYSAALQPTAVMDTLSDMPCPNSKEPSDHLPVAATFKSSF